MSVWDFDCPVCGQRGRWGTAAFPERGTVPPGLPGEGQILCQCSGCDTPLRIAPRLFLNARPYPVSSEVLAEARTREFAQRPGAARDRLLELLQRLSAAAEDQRRYLEKIDDETAGELINELWDWFELEPAAAEGVGPRGQDSLRAIESQVEKMLPLDHVWDPSALSTAPEWEELRRLARIAADDVRRGW